MRIIRSDSHDVYFNLATEQYLLHEQSEDILMLWQSESAVVCVKHQNACAEANYAFCKANNIHIARRLSGGGTVFHEYVSFGFVCKNILEGRSGDRPTSLKTMLVSCLMNKLCRLHRFSSKSELCRVNMS